MRPDVGGAHDADDAMWTSNAEFIASVGAKARLVIQRGRPKTVPVSLTAADIEVELFPALSSFSDQWKGGLWWGSSGFFDERTEALQVWKQAREATAFPDPQFALLPKGKSGSKVPLQTFKEWVVAEHNAGRLPGFITSNAKEFGYPGRIAPSLVDLRGNLEALLAERGPMTEVRDHLEEQHEEEEVAAADMAAEGTPVGHNDQEHSAAASVLADLCGLSNDVEMELAPPMAGELPGSAAEASAPAQRGRP